jgi:hypothetical protein
LCLTFLSQEEVVKTILCSLRLGERENCDLDLMLDYDHEVAEAMIRQTPNE